MDKQPPVKPERPKFKDKALGHLGRRFFIEASPGCPRAFSFLGRLVEIHFQKIDDVEVNIRILAYETKVSRKNNKDVMEDGREIFEVLITVTHTSEMMANITYVEKGEVKTLKENGGQYCLENSKKGYSYMFVFLE